MFSVLSIRVRLPVVILLLLGQRVLGQDQEGRLNVLKGRDGQSSCQLKDTVHAACSTSPSPALNVTPTPTVCTCNNIFFNIWSACSFSTGNNTLPVFSSWLATCTDNSIDLGRSDAMKDAKDGLGIDIPRWAAIAVPGNTSFDLQRAVVLQLPPNSWSVLQMSLPVVTALSAVMFTLLTLKMIRRSRPTVPSLPGGLSRMMHPGRRVRTLDQRSLNDWEIEPPNPHQPVSAIPGDGHRHPQPQPRSQTPVVRPPSPPDTPNRERESTIPGHPSMYSETPRQSVIPESTYTGQNYPFGPQEQERFQRQPLRPAPSDLYTGTSTPQTFRSSIRDMRLPNPFRRKPVVIVPVEPSEGFRIDGSSVGSSSVRASATVASDAGIRMTGMSFDAIEEEDRAEDRHSEAYYSSHYDEATNLITDQERRDSALEHENYSTGTRSTHGTSINSRVRVVSPTASTISPRSTMQPPAPTPSSVQPRQVVLPPVPKVPAPLPPPGSARTPARVGINIQPGLAAAASSSRMMMSPILENQLPDPTHSRQGYSSIYPSSSSDSRPTPTRSFSNDSTHSTESRRPLPSPALSSPAASHQRSVSNESSRTRGLLPDRPLFGTTASPPPLGAAQSPPSYSHTHRRSGSNNSASSGQMFLPESLYDDPFSPNLRGLSADDTASFYLTPEPFVRSATPSSSRTDPAAYFPGAVKGAGYGV